MFYSPVYLKKTGRFGLIWLSATRTKILSKRELAAIDMSRICSDILTHIPGLRKDKESRASRFSLYLCCQLMYGCVRVLQKQWEFLLVDAQALCKRCTDTPSTTYDIDLAATRQAASIESNVPRDARDANLDPYFGAIKEATIDVESMLAYLESESESKLITLEPIPMPARPEIGSPHSVSDPQEIQIRDVAMPPMAVQTYEEPDLPKMDIESFLSISQDESFQEIQERLGVVRELETSQNQSMVDGQIISGYEEQGVMIETEDGYVSMMRDVLMDCLPQTDILMDERGPLSPLEETPMAKPTSSMPGPPHKPKIDGPKRQRDPTRKGSKFQDICNGDMQLDQSLAPVAIQTSSDDSFLLNQQRKEAEKEQEAGDRGHGHDWAQKNAPTLDLPPITTTTDSPLRKKRPHKLVIDQFLKISRLELKQNMEGTSDILLPMQLPDTTKDRNVYREPALSYMRQKTFVDLFSKNCKFGLKMDDTGSEPDSLPSPRLADFLSRKRARGAVDAAETPANKIPRHSSEVASMEIARGRTEGSLSESVDRNLSHSLIGEGSDQKQLSTSMRSHSNLPFEHNTSRDGSISEIDRTLNIGGALTTWPEEQELNRISPARHLPETSAQNIEVIVQTVTDEPGQIAPETSPQQEPTIASNAVSMDSTLMNSDTPRTAVYKLVENNLRSKNDWTTFKAVCPPSAYTKKVAASMFNALCAQLACGKLCARQDEPYTSIFIWVQECTSGSSTSTES